MPSLRPTEPESSSGLFSGKMILLYLLILGTVAYAVNQYMRLRHPAPTPVANPSASARLANLKGDALYQRLGLTSKQKEQIADLKKKETDPAKLRRETAKLLTPDQREKLKMIRDFQAEKRKERKAKFYPGSDLEIAKEGNQKIKDQTEQRRKAAQAAKAAAQKPKPAPTPTPTSARDRKASP